MTSADLAALRLSYHERLIESLAAWCRLCGRICSGPHPKREVEG